MELANTNNQIPNQLSLLDIAAHLAQQRKGSLFSIDDAIYLWEKTKENASNITVLKQILNTYQFTETARNWLSTQQQKYLLPLSLILNQLIIERDLPSSLNFKIEEKQVLKQQNNYPAVISFKEAIHQAVQLFLHDYNIDESPGFIITQIHPHYHTTTIEGKKQLLNKIKELLTNAELELIPDTDWHDRNFVYFEPPFYDEKIEDNWIFSLRLFDLSKHVFWAIIPRDGKHPSYCYGFN